MTKANREQYGEPDPAVSGSGGNLTARISIVVGLFETKSMAAKAAGISPEQLARQVKGINRPFLDTMAALCSVHGVSLDWLVTGEGPMYLRDRVSQGGASEMEQALGKDLPFNDDLLANVVEGLDTWLADKQANPPSRLKSQLISVLYRLMAIRRVDLQRSGGDTSALDEAGHPISIENDAMLLGIARLIKGSA